MAKGDKKNPRTPAKEASLRQSREFKEPRLRSQFIRKIRLKDKLNTTQNYESQEFVNQKPSASASFKRRYSMRNKSPVKERGASHFDSSKFEDLDRMRPASTLGIRGRRWSRPQSPEEYSPVQSTVKSAIDFTKQIPRDPFVDPKKGPNEHRFEMLKTPKVLSSYKEPHPPQFKLSNGRLLLTKKDVYLPDYDVNMDSIGKPLGQGVPLFEKFVKRKDPAIEKTFTVPECYPFSQIEKAEKQLSNFTEQARMFNARKKLIPMKKQLPRDNRMYNINQGFNLKPKRESLNSNQRLDSALSFYESQEEQRVRSRASTHKVIHGVERKYSEKRRYSLTAKGERGGRKSPPSFKIQERGMNSLHEEWQQLGKLTEKRLKMSEIEL